MHVTVKRYVLHIASFDYVPDYVPKSKVLKHANPEEYMLGCITNTRKFGAGISNGLELGIKSSIKCPTNKDVRMDKVYSR